MGHKLRNEMPEVIKQLSHRSNTKEKDAQKKKKLIDFGKVKTESVLKKNY